MAKFFLCVVFGLIVVANIESGRSEDVCDPVTEQYNSCGSACPDYCNKGDEPEVCTLQCVIGCQCAPGYVREAIDSELCVPERTCRRMPSCGRNKTFYMCGTPCPRSCDNLEPVNCERRCERGCQCKPGYVLTSENSNSCIPVSECPKE